MLTLVAFIALLAAGFALYRLAVRSKESGRENGPRSADAPEHPQYPARSNLIDKVKMGLTVRLQDPARPIIVRFIGSTNLFEVRSALLVESQSDVPVVITKLSWDLWSSGLHIKHSESRRSDSLGQSGSVRIELRETLLDSEAADVSWANQAPNAKVALEGVLFIDTVYGKDRLAFAFQELALAFDRQNFKLKTEDFIKESYMDGLTGLLQRKFIEDNLQTILNRNATFEPISLIMIDADDFKSINDGFGHLAGDETLRTLARIIKAVVANRGFTVRYGGDEFCVILENCGVAEAKQIAEQFVHEIAGTYIDFEQKRIEFAVSVGIASTTRPVPYQELIQRADDMLLFSKKNGKNKISVDNRRMVE